MPWHATGSWFIAFRFSSASVQKRWKKVLQLVDTTGCRTHCLSCSLRPASSRLFLWACDNDEGLFFYLSPSSCACTCTHKRTSPTIRYPEWPPRSTLIMTTPQGWGNRITVGADGGRRAGCISRLKSQSGVYAHNTHTSTVVARTPLECLECCLWPHKGEKQKGGGGLRGVSGPDHVQRRRGSDSWNVRRCGGSGLEFNSEIYALLWTQSKQRSACFLSDGVCHEFRL